VKYRPRSRAKNATTSIAITAISTSLFFFMGRQYF
jgi:hypothetical protein